MGAFRATDRFENAKRPEGPEGWSQLRVRNHPSALGRLRAAPRPAVRAQKSHLVISIDIWGELLQGLHPRLEGAGPQGCGSYACPFLSRSTRRVPRDRDPWLFRWIVAFFRPLWATNRLHCGSRPICPKARTLPQVRNHPQFPGWTRVHLIRSGPNEACMICLRAPSVKWFFQLGANTNGRSCNWPIKCYNKMHGSMKIFRPMMACISFVWPRDSRE